MKEIMLDLAQRRAEDQKNPLEGAEKDQYLDDLLQALAACRVKVECPEGFGESRETFSLKGEVA